MRRRERGTKRVHALDPEERLFEVGSREVWQSLLITADGGEVGPVVRQVVEARMYTVRYLVVYDVEAERHLLLPSNTIVDITDARVYSSLTREEVRLLPTFRQRPFDRSYEEQIYRAVGRTPYWVEEAPFSSRTSPGEEPEP